MAVDEWPVRGWMMAAELQVPENGVCGMQHSTILLPTKCERLLFFHCDEDLEAKEKNEKSVPIVRSRISLSDDVITKLNDICAFESHAFVCSNE